ncbi:MAG: formate dehydrogenase accessory protein FdhE [Actinomycetota bacterium]|nr:formate dehydrogenase accessory protein FdhE [Actinomycetota bacterium]
MRATRGGPGDFKGRLARAAAIESSAATAGPLALLVRVLGHQLARSADPSVQAAGAQVAAEAIPNRLVQRFPLLDLAASVEAIVAELEPAVATLAHTHISMPAPLATIGRETIERPELERRELVATWIDDPSLLDSRLAQWVRVAAAPILEHAAGRVDPPSRDEWSGSACPACGDVPQASVIVEESGAFLQGAPRYLICARCASWWVFPRARCPSCGEDDSRRLGPYVADEWRWARIDACDTCRAYMKTFDLRDRGAREVIPLVDDVATLALDVWAHQMGFHRPALSLAGV